MPNGVQKIATYSPSSFIGQNKTNYILIITQVRQDYISARLCDGDKVEEG